MASLFEDVTRHMEKSSILLFKVIDQLSSVKTKCNKQDREIGEYVKYDLLDKAIEIRESINDFLNYDPVIVQEGKKPKKKRR